MKEGKFDAFCARLHSNRLHTYLAVWDSVIVVVVVVVAYGKNANWKYCTVEIGYRSVNYETNCWPRTHFTSCYVHSSLLLAIYAQWTASMCWHETKGRSKKNNKFNSSSLLVIYLLLFFSLLLLLHTKHLCFV